MAVKTHEINIKGTTAWNQLTANNYMIIQANSIAKNDYVLFKQVEELDVGTTQETGLFQMTQVVDIVQNEGLKEGYILIVFNKL